jgi:biotin operon repressor
MNPSNVYETLLEELAAGELTDLQRKVFHLLRDNPDGLDRYQLVNHIFGYIPVKIDGNTDDRKIRKAIEKLRQRLFPIISTSGKPGYRLDTSREAVQKMIRELRSRRDRIDEQIQAASKFYSIPVVYQPDPSQVEQLRMAL